MTLRDYRSRLLRRYLCLSSADEHFAHRAVQDFHSGSGRRIWSSDPQARRACAMDAAEFLGEKTSAQNKRRL